MKGESLTAAGRLVGVYRISSALEVVSDPDDHRRQVPGLRHWIEDMLISYQHTGTLLDGLTACGEPVVGMILTPCYPEKLTCDGCIAAWVARELKKSPD